MEIIYYLKKKGKSNYNRDHIRTDWKYRRKIKLGLSIYDILPFFVKYRLQLRVFASVYNLIYRYDPPNVNHHNKVLYCMMKYDHIYTLNHNIKSLEQQLAKY
ncbi:MAG: hypothetical protein ACKPKO_46965 [Candidatus Fonsibacter sp.]